jgi:hypothetical protein
MNLQATNTPGFFIGVNPTDQPPESSESLHSTQQQFMTDQNHILYSPDISQDSLIVTPQNMVSLGDFGGSLVSPMARLPKPRKKKAPTRRAKDWEPYKARILDLHDTQNLSLKTVKNMIENEFGFTAEYVPPLFVYHTCSESSYLY